MTTERLYYDDPYLTGFSATVLRAERRDDREAVWLDRTAFYPTTGGQPFDTGSLGPGRVEGVEEDDSGDVMHLVRASPGGLAAGTTVSGSIDWGRRFDHMQQHSGQHVLSAILQRLFAVRTVGFHLGTATSTIDLAREMTTAEITTAEDEANRVVWENRRVSIRYASAEEAAALPLRKESIRTGTLRLIEVADLDLSACGGTHVDHTGSIGAIVVNRWERFKGGQRLEFLCGGRAVARFRTLRNIGAGATALLSVQIDDLVGGVERLQAEVRDRKRTLGVLQGELARYQADELARTAVSHGAVNAVLATVKGDAETLKSVAAAITARPGFIAVLVSDATPALVVAARSADSSISCHDVVTQLTKRFGGRGGGRPTLAQAGGLQGSVEEILAAAGQIIPQ